MFISSLMCLWSLLFSQLYIIIQVGNLNVIEYEVHDLNVIENN